MTLAADLVALLGRDRVLSEPLERYLYGTDAGVSRGEAVVVALPDNSAEVAGVVKLARRHGTPIVPRGAGTGLAGGATPARPALVVSLTRMTDVEIDHENHTAWVGPGVINLDLSRLTAGMGYHFAPDPSSQSACTIGGNVATATGIIARGIVPAALEIMDHRMTVAVERFVGAGFPTDAGAVLLAEVAGHGSAVEGEAAVVEEVAKHAPPELSIF